MAGVAAEQPEARQLRRSNMDTPRKESDVSTALAMTLLLVGLLVAACCIGPHIVEYFQPTPKPSPVVLKPRRLPMPAGIP